MLEKVSRKHFMDTMDGKLVTLMTACVVGKAVFAKAIKSLENADNYNKIVSAPINPDKYTGIFNKLSNGFFREMRDGRKSFKTFSKGSYVLSDGNLSFIVAPDTMLVCIYRTEN